ncbi:guanine nucleotide-binding protein G(I)/G(S)/G(O) subunit gamma-4-like [Apodemus sylvaticus]|uniref:guanine nucleotide-binding protein G(I)/G(S)/G(O) subunit gamma-4-like n=1 Tax=Apodemus sylvaticus TaxID=10129 RepID=UPI00224309B0|nr:guanine nucleotide-binding protein G(I)/G(S)/G(O) subunit gamma-4-like [Apodemus sylvaticus]
MPNDSTTSISQTGKAVEQLKMTSCMDSVKVFQTAYNLVVQCEALVPEDFIIILVPASENLF